MKRRGKYDTAAMDFIDRYWTENYCPPAMRTVMAGVGISSTSTTRALMRRLCSRHGYSMLDARRATIAPPWVQRAIRDAALESVAFVCGRCNKRCCRLEQMKSGICYGCHKALHPNAAPPPATP